MDFKENLKIAIYSLKSNKFRSVLTMLGIIIGVASVITIITVGNSGRDYIMNLSKSFGGQSETITVDSVQAESSDYITENDIDALRKIDTVNYVSPLIAGVGNLSSNIDSGVCVSLGTNEDFINIMSNEITYGRYFTKQEYQSQKNVAVIDEDTAIAFFGIKNAVGKSIDFIYNGSPISLTIVGIVRFNINDIFGGSADMMQSFMGSVSSATTGKIFLPSSVYKTMSSKNYYYTIYLSTENVYDLDSAGESAINMLTARHNNFGRNIYKASNMSSIVNLLDTVINIFTVFVSSIGAISLVVGGIGVMNIMLVSVTERTREIGIRKALGAKTGTILLQFLTESIIICLIGGIIGMLIAFGISYCISLYMGIPLKIQFSAVLIAIGFSSAIGIFFGIHPAKKAAKMPPIEALRST